MNRKTNLIYVLFMTIYYRPAFLMSTLIVSAPVRGSPAPEHYVCQWIHLSHSGILTKKKWQPVTAVRTFPYMGK